MKFNHWRITNNFVDSECFFLINSDMTYKGYHHIDIEDNYQKYLGFFWEIDCKISYFIFIVLSFSLSSAPFIFTKVMRCLVKFFGKGRNKKFAYILTTVLDTPPPHSLPKNPLHISHNDETWRNYILPKVLPEKMWIMKHILWVLLISAFFHRKSANFAISKNTDIDCIFIHNF